MVSDANVFVITPVSSNSFIESVRLRSMDNARVRFDLDIFSSLAISSKVSFSAFPL